MRNHLQKFRHNKNTPEKRVNLEVLVLECKSCQELKTHIYHGKNNNKFIYRCMYCDTAYESSKKLEEYNLKNLKNGK